jgi:type IV secretion system protein VirD4
MTASTAPRAQHSRSELWWAWFIGGAGVALIVAAVLATSALEGGALLSHGCVVRISDIAAALSPYQHAADPRAGFGAADNSSCAPDAPLFWTVFGVEAALVATVAIGVLIMAISRKTAVGFASPRTLRALHARAQRARTASLRPALSAQARRRARMGALALPLGSCHRRRLYGSLEDVYLVVGGIRRGKTGLLTEMVADWEGPMLLTTTKPGDLETLLGLLAATPRRTLLFDPGGLSPWPHRAWWNPVASCLDPRVAAARANAMMAPVRRITRVEGVDWGLLAELLLTCLLHAAAIDELGMDSVHAWSQSSSVGEVAERLGRSPLAPHWRRTVELQAGSAPETWASIQINLQTALAAVRQPTVMRWLQPPGDSSPAAEIVPASVIEHGDAVVILGGDAAQTAMAPLTAALADAVIEAGLVAARRSPRGRLDPPLLLALDEMPKVAPLPALPRLASEGSSQGVVPVMVAQDPAQLREAFGDNVADSLWTCASVKVVFGGITNLGDREQLSALSREIEVEERPRASLGGSRRDPVTRRVRALSVDAVHAIPREQAVVVIAGLDPIRVRVPGPHRPASRLHTRWLRAQQQYSATVGWPA